MVTVVIPNYNHAPFLNKRIDSVLNQSYQDFEVIILDDCSVDSSREVIEEYRGNPKITNIVYNEKNSGSVFKQWERGVNLANGEFIWIAESDDFAESNFLESLMPVIISNPNVGLCYSDSNIINGSEKDAFTFSQYRKTWLNSVKWESSYINEGRKEIKENLMKMCTINNASSVIFRKDAIYKVQPFDLKFRYIGDWYCYLKICLNYDIAYVNIPLNNYREHSNNSFKLSRKSIVFVDEYFRLYSWVLTNIKFIDKDVVIDLFNGHTRHSVYRNLTRSTFRLYRELYGLNPSLFIKMMKSNLIAPFVERAKKDKF